MAKFRFHRGSLADSMDTMIEVSSKEELLKRINDSYHFGKPETFLEITRYGDPDPRIDWEGCYIVCGHGGPIGFIDRPL